MVTIARVQKHGNMYDAHSQQQSTPGPGTRVQKGAARSLRRVAHLPSAGQQPPIQCECHGPHGARVAAVELLDHAQPRKLFLPLVGCLRGPNSKEGEYKPIQCPEDIRLAQCSDILVTVAVLPKA